MCCAQEVRAAWARRERLRSLKEKMTGAWWNVWDRMAPEEAHRYAYGVRRAAWIVLLCAGAMCVSMLALHVFPSASNAVSRFSRYGERVTSRFRQLAAQDTPHTPGFLQALNDKPPGANAAPAWERIKERTGSRFAAGLARLDGVMEAPGLPQVTRAAQRAESLGSLPDLLKAQERDQTLLAGTPPAASAALPRAAERMDRMAARWESGLRNLRRFIQTVLSKLQ